MTAVAPVAWPLAQTATPTPGVGPSELLDYWPAAVRLGWFLAGAVVVVVVGWVLLEPAISRVVTRRNRNNQTIQEAITRYVRLLILLGAVVVGTGVAGYTRLLTNSALVVAAGTLVIGVAAQAVIGSLVSGLVLVLDPEFNVGDYIAWDGYEGTVRSIRLRVTRVQTQDGELVTVPNTALTGQAITRPYGRERYRVVDRFHIDYDDNVPIALGIFRQTALTVDGIATEPTPAAYVETFEAATIQIRVHYWVEQPRPGDLFEIRSAYARACKRRLDAAGVTVSPVSEFPLSGRVEVVETQIHGK